MAYRDKYAMLPGLDTGKDVYETPDYCEEKLEGLNEGMLKEVEETETNEDISNDRLNLGMVKNRFLKEEVNAEEVDFSERVGRKSKRSYQTKNFHDYGVIEETVEKKLARLRRELEEIRLELLDEQKEKMNSMEEGMVHKSFADLNELDHQITELQNQAKKSAIATLEKRLQEFSLANLAKEEDREGNMMEMNHSENQSLKYTLDYNPKYKEKYTELNLSELENRLTVLEKSLGINHMHSYTLQAPILPTLSHLNKKIMLLTSNKSYIDLITKKVKDLVAEMEILHEKKSKIDSDTNESTTISQEEKIDALYSNLETIQNISCILPNLLDRLKALRIVHADAATVTTGLKDCTERQNIIQDEMIELKQTLERVEFAIKESKNTIQSNMTEIEKMVQEIEKKIKFSENN